MLVLPVPRSPLHSLSVDKRSDVVGADPGGAARPSLVWLQHLLYGFSDGVPLSRARVAVISSVSIVPLADLSGGGQAFQRHADWSRHVSGALGA